MRLIIMAVTLLTSVITATVDASMLQTLPSEVTVTRRFFSWTSDFDITAQGVNLGRVHRKFFTKTLRYDYFSPEKELLAYAKLHWLNWGALFEVWDVNQNLIGMVEERSLTFYDTFAILAPTGEVAAIANMNFWGTTYTVTDPDTSIAFATFSRPYFRVRDSWTMTLLDPEVFERKQIDPSLFILVMAFHADRDMWTMQKLEEEAMQQE